MSHSLSRLFLKYGYQVCSWNTICPLPNKLLIWLTHIQTPVTPPTVILGNGAPIFKPVQRILCPPATNLRLPLGLFFKHLISAWKVEHWQSAFPPNVICVISENLASNADALGNELLAIGNAARPNYWLLSCAILWWIWKNRNILVAAEDDHVTLSK